MVHFDLGQKSSWNKRVPKTAGVSHNAATDPVVRVGSGVDKSVIIVFCDDCGVRVPEGDLASGAAVRVGENRARCAECAASKRSGRAKRSGAGASPVGRKVAGVPPKRSTSARIVPVRSAAKPGAAKTEASSATGYQEALLEGVAGRQSDSLLAHRLQRLRHAEGLETPHERGLGVGRPQKQGDL